MKILMFLVWLVLIPINESDEVAQADSILQKVGYNLLSKSQVKESQMIIYGRQQCRTLTSRAYSQGHDKSFTEYLTPESEKGIKMLQLEGHLWIYSPATDSILELSGKLLLQPVMDSDLSYQDLMENPMLNEIYNARVISQEIINGRKTWVLEMNAKEEGVTYPKRKAWVDQERYVPLREELFAQSGQLLKCVTRSSIQQIEGRWYPAKVTYRDMLKEGEGTDFIVTAINFDVDIPQCLFSKEALCK